MRTHIGYGSPNKQDSADAHGAPLGEEELKLTRERLGWPQESFHIDQQVQNYYRRALEDGKSQEDKWQILFDTYSSTYPDMAKLFQQWTKGELPAGWEKDIPQFAPDEKGLATRAASGKVLNAIAAHLPNLIGGSADLAPSTKTVIREAADFNPDSPSGRNLRFGVREHAMGSILNGMALTGGLIPYGATFLVFSDYMRPPMRMAAMMGLRAIYVLTHDSIGVGEDGPTHQPVEHLTALRSIPGLTVIRPADANETAMAWRCAVEQVTGPTALILTRQNLPTLDRQKLAPAAGLARGAYILSEPKDEEPRLILLASGSEVHLVLEAAGRLEQEGMAVRVVSMPSWELFAAQSEEYQQQVLPRYVTARLAVEAGLTDGWHRYVGDQGRVIGIDHFGASAPAAVLFEKFGFTVDNIVDQALQMAKDQECF